MDWGLLARVALGPAPALLRRGRVDLAAVRVVGNAHAFVTDGLVPSETRLFADDRAAVRARRAGLYLQREHRRHLRPFGAAIEAHGLRGKHDFARFCAQSGVPHPPTIGIGPGGEPEAVAKIETLPGESLFVKPAFGARSHGVAVARRLGAGRWRLVARDRVREGDLGVLLEAHLPGERLVVQPILVNAPALALWAGDALAIVRIVTAIAADGTVRTLSTLAHVPLDTVQPLPQTWAHFPISPVDGTLSPLDAVERERMGVISTRVAALAGRRIETAAALRGVAETAHARLVAAAPCRLPPTIGWDAAWSSDGPMLIELNWNWAVAPHYRNAAGLDFRLSPRFASAVHSPESAT